MRSAPGSCRYGLFFFPHRADRSVLFDLSLTQGTFRRFCDAPPSPVRGGACAVGLSRPSAQLLRATPGGGGGGGDAEAKRRRGRRRGGKGTRRRQDGLLVGQAHRADGQEGEARRRGRAGEATGRGGGAAAALRDPNQARERPAEQPRRPPSRPSAPKSE